MIFAPTHGGAMAHAIKSRDECGWDLDRSGAGLCFRAGTDRIGITVSRVCQLKYAMLYV